MSTFRVRLILQDVRGTYLTITPRDLVEHKKERYQMQVLLENSDPQIEAIQVAVRAVAKAVYPAMPIDGVKQPLRDGNKELLMNPQKGEQYKDHTFFNLTALMTGRDPNVGIEPAIIRDGAIVTANPEEVQQYCYWGARFNVAVTFYDYPVVNSNGKALGAGVAAGLENIMLLRRDPTPIGARVVPAAEDFAGFGNAPAQPTAAQGVADFARTVSVARVADTEAQPTADPGAGDW